MKAEMVANKQTKNINSPRVEIHYCSQCRFILRASWLAQELLMTFGEKLGELVLIPVSGGVFTITLDGTEIFSKKSTGKFPRF